MILAVLAVTVVATACQGAAADFDPKQIVALRPAALEAWRCCSSPGHGIIDLVDNPRLDHEYTVFAYVQRHPRDHMEIVDTILEGEVITRVEIIERR